MLLLVRPARFGSKYGRRTRRCGFQCWSVNFAQVLHPPQFENLIGFLFWSCPEWHRCHRIASVRKPPWKKGTSKPPLCHRSGLESVCRQEHSVVCVFFHVFFRSSRPFWETIVRMWEKSLTGPSVPKSLLTPGLRATIIKHEKRLSNGTIMNYCMQHTIA